MERMREKKKAKRTSPATAKILLLPTSPLPSAASVRRIMPRVIAPYSIMMKYVSRTNWPCNVNDYTVNVGFFIEVVVHWLTNLLNAKGAVSIVLGRVSLSSSLNETWHSNLEDYLTTF